MTLLEEKQKPYERYFFDIPVFRTDIITWAGERKAKEKEFVQRIIIQTSKYTTEEFAREYAKKLIHPSWSAYHYSELIGMIRLFTMNQQIRADLFFVRQKISRNLKNKKWEYFGKLFEYQLISVYTNQTIFNWIVNRLKEENKNSNLLKKRYIDIEAFKYSGRYIDFIELADFGKIR